MLQRHRHAMENTILLPFAYSELTPEDKTEFGRKMAARRGVIT